MTSTAKDTGRVLRVADAAERNPQDVIEELCRMRELVAREVFKCAHATDCCCGRGGSHWDKNGSWPHSPGGNYLDDGVVNAFIRAAVLEKIAAVKAGRRTARTTIVRPLPR